MKYKAVTGLIETAYFDSSVVLYFLIRISALLPSLIGCGYFARSLAFSPRDYEQTTKYNVHAFQLRLSRLE